MNAEEAVLRAYGLSKMAAFRAVLAAHGLGNASATGLDYHDYYRPWQQGTPQDQSGRHNHIAESNANSDTLQSLLSAFDRKPDTTGDESGVGTPFMEGTTG